jgi:hypothetical protein
MIPIKELNKGDIVFAKMHSTLEAPGCVVNLCGAGCCIQLELADQYPYITMGGVGEYRTVWMQSPSAGDSCIEVYSILKRGHKDRCPQCKRTMCGFSSNEVEQ